MVCTRGIENRIENRPKKLIESTFINDQIAQKLINLLHAKDNPDNESHDNVGKNICDEWF